MTTNILNLPGNYNIKAINGYVIIDSGNDTTVNAGANFDVNANNNATIDAGGDIQSTAGGNINNTAVGEITNEAGSNFIADAGSAIELTAGSDITGEAGGNIDLTAGSDATVNAGGSIELTAGSEVTVEAPTRFYVDSPDSEFTGDLQVDEDTVLGDSDARTIDVRAKFISSLIPQTSATYNIGTTGSSWASIHVEFARFYNENNVSNQYLRPYDPNDVYGEEGQRLWEDWDSGTQTGTVPSSAYFAGGVGIKKDLNVGGYIYGRIETANTALTLQVTSTNVDQYFYPIFVLNTGQQILFLDKESIYPSEGLRYNASQGKLVVDRMGVFSPDSSTSTTTGALTVAGGVGIGENINVGGSIIPDKDDAQWIGTETNFWHEGYINNIFTRVIESTTGSVKIDPASALTEIIGDIRVRGGNNPIGTAPVVTNTLYVTPDGNDTNDGRAMDPSRACRTIGGAVNSPYYQPGTQILVSAGFYLEDNPIRMKPYTSIRGSDIRTTFVEPINKTQDLFHVDSGCYINYMTFLNGRSGLLEGPYEQGFNRGAYATAFPPLVGDERIDLFHSPYIQNCTNQSGPWLKDGTMFVPNQTVQVPRAIGTGTWQANTTTITVTSDGVISKGMTINAGQQNLGFFDARTLMLANKPFLQEQIIAFVDQTFNSGFSYNEAKCFRDVGFIIDSIALDLKQDSVSESIFAGLQYFQQDGYVDAIEDQITTTTQAISYVKSLAVTTATDFGDAIAGAIVSAAFDKILEIVTTATTTATYQEWISGSIVVNSTASTTATIVDAYDALILAKETIQNQTLDYIINTLGFSSFNTSTCVRDIGYMIDSVAFDLLHGGNKQSIKAGVYYFEFVDNTNIPSQVAQTVAAYSFIRSLVSNIVLATPLISTYQSTVTQVTAYNSATIYEVESLQDKIDTITNIIRNGPDTITTGTRVPIDLDTSGAIGVLNAYELLNLNRDFIQHETIAYINETFGSFEYSREKCFRDVGILVENISYDASFGGNQKAVESGLAYYDGVISRISGQETQTISAIDYLNQLCQDIVVNTVVPDLLSGTGTYAQVINTALIGGAVAVDSIDNLFNIVTTIINDGPEAAPQIYTSTGPDAAFVSAQTLIEANRKFIQQDTINWINNTFLSFPYSEIKCRRDTGLIIDAVAFDLLYPTASNSQATFAGLQYWSQDDYVGDIKDQLNPTVDAIGYLKSLSTKIIQNITPVDDLVARYQSTITQVTTMTAATSVEVDIIEPLFDIIIEILEGNKLGWTDKIISNLTATQLASTNNAVELLQANKNYLGHEVTAYVNAVNSGLVYDIDKCRRDVGHIVDSVCFDLLHGGNRQVIQNGLYYYGFSTIESVISHQTTQTVAAFNHLASIMQDVIQNIIVTATYQLNAGQNISLTTATIAEAIQITDIISTITNIIVNGESVAAAPEGISLVASTSTDVRNAFEIILANKQFLIEETIGYIDRTYNPLSFNYNEEKCFRDVGLILDAVGQDILLGGNQKSIEAGLSYWSAGYNSVAGQETTTTMAINHARDITLQIIANQPVTPQTGTIVRQVINPFFQYGGDYMPQQNVARSFGIITKIIQDGPIYAPPVYAGGGLFALTGLNGADVKIAPTVVEVTTVTTGTYLVALSTATIGFGTNATLYFGDTLVFPLRDYEVEEQSYEYTGNTSTWNLRKVDQIGSMGGSLVDGGVISDRSPIQSFVYDAFTQVTQGGRGVHIINDGYAQLVSVFTIFCSTGVEVESGGIASIVNSNANFGNVCLQARGYGKRKFSGTVYNPAFLAWNSDTRTREPDLDQYFPNGFWPNNAKVLIYCPDLEDRPHISLVMEVVPPIDYENEQAFPGFLNASPTTSTLTTGTITLYGVDNTGVAVGNAVYVRDQFGRTTSTVYDPVTGWVPYVQPGTVVTDVGYKTITLNKALSSGGGEVDNPNYFDFYFCGNAYYTVLSSETSVNPKPEGVNILSTASTGGEISQIPIHIASLRHLNTITNQVIGNVAVTSLQTSTSTTQLINPFVLGGDQATAFINLRFQEMIDIIDAPNVTAAENTIPPRLRTTTGPAVQGGGSAITLIRENIEFLADEVVEYVKANAVSSFSYDEAACRRDAGYVIDGIYYDVGLGTNFNSITNGNAYRRGMSASVIENEFVQTVSAFNFLKEEIASNLVNGTSITRSNAGFDELLEIFNGDPPAEVTFINPVGASYTDKISAKDQLINNKAFIKQEIISWINFNYPSSYDQDQCARDVGHMIDGVCYDILYGGNSASILSANAYFDGVAAVLSPGETATTILALGRLQSILSDVVQGNIVSVTTGTSLTQNLSGSVATATEGTDASNRIQLVIDVLTAGSTSVLPAAVYPSTSWADAAIQSDIATISAIKSTIIDDMVVYINDEFNGTFNFNESKCERDVKIILQRLIYDIETGGRYNAVMVGLSYWSRSGAHHVVQLGENVTRTDLFPDGATVNFYQRSYMSASGYVFEYVGAGIDYGALPQRGVADPNQSKEVVMLDSGKVFFTSTDQNGDFRIGPGLVISQATGVLSGRTFTKSLFANMTPFILAIEGG